MHLITFGIIFLKGEQPLRLHYRPGLAYVDEFRLAMIEPPYLLRGRQIEVYIHHGKLPFPVHQRKDRGLDNMDAAEGFWAQGAAPRPPGHFLLSCLDISPAAQFVPLIEQKITGCHPVRNRQRSQRPLFKMIPDRCAKIEIGQDIRIHQ